jgi:hypothetical protein
MTAQINNEFANPNIVVAYNQLCTSYYNIDGFRQKLLSLLPLASASGIFFLAGNTGGSITPCMLTTSGIFGVSITLGLLIFEIHGIRQCTHLIVLGKFLETQLAIEGQFTNRCKGLQPFSHECRVLRYVNEPLAASVIYPSVLGGWVFLAFSPQSYLLSPFAFLFGVIVFVIGFYLLLKLNIWFVDKDCEAKWKELESRNPINQNHSAVGKS